MPRIAYPSCLVLLVLLQAALLAACGQSTDAVAAAATGQDEVPPDRTVETPPDEPAPAEPPVEPVAAAVPDESAAPQATIEAPHAPAGAAPTDPPTASQAAKPVSPRAVVREALPTADTPAASPAPKPSPGSYRIQPSGRASFLIDAPLEKIKGRWTKFGGELQLDPGDLSKTRGSVTMDLSDLRTQTFDDPGKNAKQTGHAKNWLEIGDDVDAATRKRYMTTRLTIEKIDAVSPQRLADGAMSVDATLSGKLELHGHETKVTTEVKVTFEGPAHAPTGVQIVTKKPLRVSLEHNDIKPRDLAGRFLAGALEKVGEKISDTVQVRVEIHAKRE